MSRMKKTSAILISAALLTMGAGSAFAATATPPAKTVATKVVAEKANTASTTDKTVKPTVTKSPTAVKHKKATHKKHHVAKKKNQPSP